MKKIFVKGLGMLDYNQAPVKTKKDGANKKKSVKQNSNTVTRSNDDDTDKPLVG